MSIKIPKWRIRNGEPADIEPMNDDMEGWENELDGKLNEQNWVASTFNSMTYFDAGAFIRCWYANVYMDQKIQVGVPNGTNLPTNPFEVASTGEWTVLTDIGQSQLALTGSLLWILVNLQVDHSIPGGTPAGYGIQAAIQVNGTILAETIIGGGDRANDPTGEGLGAYWSRQPLVIDAILPIGPDRVTINVVVRAPRNRTLAIPATDDKYYIYNRRSIILELV